MESKNNFPIKIPGDNFLMISKKGKSSGKKKCKYNHKKRIGDVKPIKSPAKISFTCFIELFL